MTKYRRLLLRRQGGFIDHGSLVIIAWIFAISMGAIGWVAIESFIWFVKTIIGAVL